MKTISTKNQIMDTLQWSSEEYDARVFHAYWNYCHLYGKYPSKIQQLLANSRLNHWYILQYAKAEHMFLKATQTVPNPSVNFLRGQYKAYTAQVSTFYLEPLTVVPKNSDFSNQYINNITYFAN